MRKGYSQKLPIYRATRGESEIGGRVAKEEVPGQGAGGGVGATQAVVWKKKKNPSLQKGSPI